MDRQDLQIHQQFSEYGRNAREWTRRCVLLLPEIERRQIWRKAHCGSIYEYAAKLAGMIRATVEEALRVLKKLEDKPVLQALLAEKGLQRVRPIAAIATPETEQFWVEKARTMSKHTLETYVKNYRLEKLPGEESHSVKLTMDLPVEMVEKLKTLKGTGTWEELMVRLIEGREVTAEKAPDPVHTSSRHIPVRIQRHVGERTGGLCAYPGCTRRATSLHHTQRWGLEKVHDPARLHGVCDGHERLAHLGLIENEEQAAHEWRVREQADLCADKRFIDQFVALYRPT